MAKEWPLWEVFVRGQHGLNHRHVGSLHAPDADMALKNARDVYTRRKEGVSIWVAPSVSIIASDVTSGPETGKISERVYPHPSFPDDSQRTGKTDATD